MVSEEFGIFALHLRGGPPPSSLQKLGTFAPHWAFTKVDEASGAIVLTPLVPSKALGDQCRPVPHLAHEAHPIWTDALPQRSAPLHSP